MGSIDRLVGLVWSLDERVADLSRYTVFKVSEDGLLLAVDCFLFYLDYVLVHLHIYLVGLHVSVEKLFKFEAIVANSNIGALSKNKLT